MTHLSVRPSPRRAGFTLIELVVGLLITALLSTVIFRLLLDQTRLVGTMTERGQVQQSARGAVELLASELRTAAAHLITEAEDRSVTVQAPRVWGVVCDGSTSTSIRAQFPRNAFPADFQPAAGVEGWGLAVPNPVVPIGSTWMRETFSPELADRYDRRMLSAATNHQPLAGCVGADTALVTVRVLTLASALTVAVPSPGTRVGLYETIRYFAQNNTAIQPAGHWIYRQRGTTAAQPLAGPLIDAQGLEFRYLNAEGALLAGTARLDPTQLRRIQVRVSGTSRTQATRAQQQVDSLSVFLRN